MKGHQQKHQNSKDFILTLLNYLIDTPFHSITFKNNHCSLQMQFLQLLLIFGPFTDFGDRYNPTEARREIGYLVHIASRINHPPKSVEDACSLAPAGCSPYETFDVSGSNFVEGRKYHK